MNELQVFSNPDFGEVRTLVINDMPWAVGKDVAQALGYKNTKDAIARHVDPEDKRGSRFTTPSGPQEMTIINESGLYSLILSSKLPAAKQFKRWITSEVLPTIRRTGSYSIQTDSGAAYRLMEELLRVKEENAALKIEAIQREADDLRRQLVIEREMQAEAEHRRELNRERQRRYRERQKSSKN